MNLVFSQHSIIKTQENLTYYFFLNNHHELCYRLFNEDNTLLKIETLVTEIVVDFSAAINSSNEIHLICITKVGNFLYYIGLDNRWEHSLLSKLDMRSNLYKYLSLFIHKDDVHIFWIKANLLNPIVSSIEHMYWDDKKHHHFTVTSYLPGKYPSPYQVQIDQLNNVHLIYKSFYKNNHQLYYSKFNYFNKKWMPGEIISSLDEDHSHPYMLIDKNMDLHLLWCTIENSNFILKYRKKINVLNQKSKWSDIHILSNRNANHLSPIIIQQGPLLKVLSRQNQYITEIVSQDHGNSWMSIPNNKIYKGNEALLIRYSSNSKQEKSTYSIHYVYGEIKDYILLFGTKLYKIKNNANSNFKQIDPNVKDDKNSSTIINIDKKNDGEDPSPNENLIENIESIDKVNLNNGNNDVNFEEITHPPAKTFFLSNPNDDVSLEQALKNIEINIASLMVELEKLEEIKGLLQDRSSIKDKVNPSTDYNRPKMLFDSFSLLKKDLFSIEKTQTILEKDFEVFGNKLDSLEEKIILHREELLYLQKCINEVSYGQGIFSKIKNFFR